MIQAHDPLASACLLINAISSPWAEFSHVGPYNIFLFFWKINADLVPLNWPSITVWIVSYNRVLNLIIMQSVHDIASSLQLGCKVTSKVMLLPPCNVLSTL